jgi:hypothetical protein
MACLAATAAGEIAFHRHVQPPIPRTRRAGARPHAAGSPAPAGICGARGPEAAAMSGPAWLAGGLAVLMIAIAVYCACRLAVSRVQGGDTERDADGLHVLMGVAMAGMLEPRLTAVPGAVWTVVFAAGAAWFAWHAIRAGGRGAARTRCAHPVPHAIESAAMVYMFLPVGSWQAARGPGMVMPGMSPGASQGNPAITLLLALFMLGYVLWAIDRLAGLFRATAAYGYRPVIVALSPRGAACYKIAMASTMGYMLVMML